LPAELHDRACRLAIARGVSVGQVLREAFEAFIHQKPPEPIAVRQGRI
jgi:hypothetical protein